MSITKLVHLSGKLSKRAQTFIVVLDWVKATTNFILYPQIYMRFLEYEMHNSNECKRNFVAIYDGSSSVEHLKNKFCSTVANDVMLVSSLGVVRLWADEGSRKSRFKILFTTFHERKRQACMHPHLAPSGRMSLRNPLYFHPERKKTIKAFFR